MAELLAPAGTPDALRAAIAAGADAVYVGLGAFNARAANAGFTLGELERSCVLAHAHGARVYVTLNVYVRDGELDDAVALASRALTAGADALIVADLGLICRLRAELSGAELHLSTQAGAQCSDAVRFAAREFGVERVTCARELSVPELAELCATGVEIEAFCHGAICICYSGACSYSALMRGRSPNRGDCTQPCRLAYELQDGSGTVLAGGAWERARATAGEECPDGAPEADAGVSAGAAKTGVRDRASVCPDGDRLLCPRDYLGIRHVAEMVEAGVSAFKIEGRMKSPDYVYNVVRCYRAALDAALAGRPLGEAEFDELEARLARSFNRGFTSGYLEGGHVATGAGLMSFERAINQGLFVGRVSEPRHEGALVSFGRDVAAGDMLEIHSTPGADAPADVPKRWPIVACPRDVRSGEDVFIPCKRKVEAGGAVHVVRSAGTISEADAAVRAMREEEARLVGEARGVVPAAAGADVPGVDALGACVGDGEGAGNGRCEGGSAPASHVPASNYGQAGCSGSAVVSDDGGARVADSSVSSALGPAASSGASSVACVGVGRAAAEPVRFAHARRGRKNGREMPGCDSVAYPDQTSAGTGGKTVAKCQSAAAWQIPTVSEAVRDGGGAVAGTATWATSGAAAELPEGDAGESSPGAAGGPSPGESSLDIVDLGEVCRAGDLAEVRAVCEQVARGDALAVMVRNIGQIPAVLAAGVSWEAAPPLQVWNAATACALARLGARRVWIPEELTVEDLESVREHVEAGTRTFWAEPIMAGDEVRDAARAAAAGTEAPFARAAAADADAPFAPAAIRERARRFVDIVPVGTTPLMITEHCLLTAEGPCSNTCPTCPRRLASQAGERFLVELDRKSSGARLAVRVDERGRTRLYRM